jgi:2-amino-4-hydroxy-6-hydroxymethyldihydropteridine diphosphokinase
MENHAFQGNDLFEIGRKIDSGSACGMTCAFIGLGANLDAPRRRLEEAARLLTAEPGIGLLAASPIYETQPQGARKQPWFRNQVLQLDCAPRWTAHALLDLLLALENAMGRDRTPGERFGPRRIDLDMLLFGNERHSGARLCLPHPRMFDRAFVLVPLHAIASDLVFPDGSRIGERLAALGHRVRGRRIYQ